VNALRSQVRRKPHNQGSDMASGITKKQVGKVVEAWKEEAKVCLRMVGEQVKTCHGVYFVGLWDEDKLELVTHRVILEIGDKVTIRDKEYEVYTYQHQQSGNTLYQVSLVQPESSTCWIEGCDLCDGEDDHE